MLSILLLVPLIFAAGQGPSVPADEALKRLVAGNARFAAGKSSAKNGLARVRATSSGQHPFAAIVACMDSRVAPETVFDLGIGDVFAMRLGGNVVEEDTLGSLEYAAQVAGARLIVVLGHSHCGAVKGACDGVELGNLTGLLARIKPAVEAVPATVQPRTSANPAFVDLVARENVRLGLRSLREKSAVLAALEKTGGLKLQGALYDIATGKVELLD